MPVTPISSIEEHSWRLNRRMVFPFMFGRLVVGRERMETEFFAEKEAIGSVNS